MIFEELTLRNFRQFAGEQKLTFATDASRNVTVIHGFNGSGKTTLLNAFTWLLYGQVSSDFEAPEQLESEAAFARLKPGEKLEVAVNAVFQDAGKKYSVTRSLMVERDADDNRRRMLPPTLRILYIGEDGEAHEPNNPQDTLEQMLPTRLYPFFFFNGERIEHLARPNAYEEIDQGIRTLLDILPFDRSIDHLEANTSYRLRQEIARRAGQDGERAQSELESLTAKRTELGDAAQQLQRNRAALEEERDAIDAKLATMPDLARWQAERKAAEEREKDAQLQLKQRKKELATELSRNGYLLLVPDVLDAAEGLLAAARQKGEIPGPIKRQFVQDLLDQGRCICGSELHPGSEHHEHVAEWKARAFSDIQETAVTVTQARLQTFRQRADDCLARITDIQRIRDDLQSALRQAREEHSELSRKIGAREHGEDPERLERRRREVNEKLVTLSLTQKEREKDLNGVGTQISEKEREIETLQLADEEGKLAQRRLDAVSNVVQALKDIRAIRFDELREDLSRQLSDVWARIAIKDYRARLDDEFRLRLTKDIGGQEEPVRGASTGEKQVLSLAFVGALCAKARSTFEQAKQGRQLFRGGLYPLVIDSAFGNLEIEYRRDVARWIPTLSPQVILIVSESQFRHEVAQELFSRIGREWILTCETPKNTSREISLHGRDYPYVKQSGDGFERTTLLEVQL